MSPAAERHMPVMAHQFAKALCDAGIIDFDLSHVRRIVIDAQEGHAVMMYVERFADDRWLDVALTLDGVEVQTSAEGYPRQDGTCHPL